MILLNFSGSIAFARAHSTTWWCVSIWRAP
jgi:hypothetical protein